jgi:hypothetical protein
MVALEARRPAVLRGDERPVDAAECLAFADMAYRSKRFGASARLHAKALRADPVRAAHTDARREVHRCVGRSDRRAQGDCSTLRSIRPKRAAAKSRESSEFGRSPIE